MITQYKIIELNFKTEEKRNECGEKRCLSILNYEFLFLNQFKYTNEKMELRRNGTNVQKFTLDLFFDY